MLKSCVNRNIPHDYGLCTSNHSKGQPKKLAFFFELKMATLEQYNNDPRVTLTNLVIASGQSTAATPLDCLGAVPVGLYIPSTFTASTITFQGLPYAIDPLDQVVANADLADILNETGTELSAVIAAGGVYLPLLPIYFNGIRFFNVNTSVAQSSGCTMSVALAPMYQGIP